MVIQAGLAVIVELLDADTACFVSWLVFAVSWCTHFVPFIPTVWDGWTCREAGMRNEVALGTSRKPRPDRCNVSKDTTLNKKSPGAATVPPRETREVRTGYHKSAAATGIDAVIPSEALSELLQAYALLRVKDAPAGVWTVPAALTALKDL